MFRLNSFRSIACIASCLLLAPAASHAAAFVSYLEPVSATAPVVIDNNLYLPEFLTRPRPVLGVLPDAYIEGYYVDSLHSSHIGELLPLGDNHSVHGIVGLFEPGTGRTVFNSWLNVAVQTYDGFHSQWISTGFHSKNALVADVLTGLQNGTYWGGLDADGSIQNLGKVIFPGSTFDIYVQAQPVPEPQTYAMMLAGLGLLGAIALRWRGKVVA